MNFTEFRGSLRENGLAVVTAEIPADLLTPASVFLRLGGDRADASFLFESVETGGAIGRYSFIGAGPVEQIWANETGGIHRTARSQQPLSVADVPAMIRARLPRSKPQTHSSPAHGLNGGWVGYFGYDWVRTLERLPGGASDTSGQPWIQLGLYDQVIVFDHVVQTAQICVSVTDDACAARGGLRRAYEVTQRRLEHTVGMLRRPHELPRLPPLPCRPVRSNMTKRDFVQGVRTIKRHIAAGDIFQCVLSQQFSIEGRARPFDVYRRLRRLNPSPYMYFLKFGDVGIAGSSPETLVRKIGRQVTTRPIAGTRPRGRNDDEDMRLERQLLASPKENAEHVMLVDLGRNDLGRVCRPGSLVIPEFRRIDRYSHVMHMVTTVEGTCRSSADALDVLAAAFPAGTVTGAPKIRAMEIIDSIEPQRRGIYAGCVGYIDFWGNLDTAIAIRTAVVERRRAYTQAGAGIVADSDPEREYRETQNKAAAPLASLGGAWKRGEEP